MRAEALSLPIKNLFEMTLRYYCLRKEKNIVIVRLVRSTVEQTNRELPPPTVPRPGPGKMTRLSFV